MIWFGLVLWHINHCRLFNAKSSFYIYIKYISFGLVDFYGISTIVGDLMLNPLYTYILDIYGKQDDSLERQSDSSESWSDILERQEF